MDKCDGRSGRKDFHAPEDDDCYNKSSEKELPPHDANSRLAALFEHSDWDINNSHRKKELPPLKDTVSIYRKKNPKKQKELTEKWHENTKPVKVKTQLSFDSADSRTNLVEKEELPSPNETSQEKALKKRTSFVNHGYDTNKESENLGESTPQNERKNRRIEFATDYEDDNRTYSPSSVHKENIYNVVCSNTVMEINDDNNNDNDEDKSKTDYRKLALELASKHSSKTKDNIKRYILPDFVLIYDVHDSDTLHKSERELFERKIQDEDINIVYDIIDGNMYVQLYPIFQRLCQEAETVALEMPLEGFLVQPAFDENLVSSLNKSMKTDNEVDMISAPFCMATRKLFHGNEDENTFFRSSHRSMLTRNILENLIISFDNEEEESGNVRKRKGLTSLLLSGSYKDAFVLNDRSSLDNVHPLKYTAEDAMMQFLPHDSRAELQNTWLKCLKYQPLWKIRNYYGEKIGLYFAWLGVLITSLWIPTILGIIVFVYGFIVAYNTKEEVSVSAVTGWITKAFDNNATPYFAVIICLWGTVFCEYWKRTNALLAYKWDVDMFEEQETNRPQFMGTTLKKNPVSGEFEPHYPKWRKALKSMGSMSIILFMVCMVVTSVVSVVVYKVVSRVDWFKAITNGAFASSMTSSVLNSISILLLGRLYKTLAYKLTEWENHQTKTKYEDALILKLFGFQFVNSYASLFYIAFFRQRTSGGVFNLGTEYSDSCGDNNDCMSLLSLQVAVLMIAKPMPKFFSDIILPFVMKHMRKMCCCLKRQSTNVVSSLELQQKDTTDDAEYESYLRHEHKKPSLNDFTLSEYTEKVLQYGYLMMFAAAFPLAPLIALITNLIDMRVDARRMLWFNRRPFAERAEDIGMWFAILSFLNYAGMITNALILGLTSQYGNEYKTRTLDVVIPGNMTAINNITNQALNSFPITIESNNNLWIILIFENVVLAVKFVIAYAIPDIPESVSEAKSQEKIQLGKLLMRSGLTLGPGKSIKPETKQTKDKKRNKSNRSSLKRKDEQPGESNNKRKVVGFHVDE